MNLLIETLNAWADHALRFAWPMLWQSSLLIGLLFALDLLMRRKLRPALRYALWLVVLVKLVLPPSLAIPTSAGWWLRPARTVPAEPRRTTVVVTYGPSESPAFPIAATPVFVAPSRPHLLPAAWAFLGMVAVGMGLLAWMLWRWHQVARDARRAAVAPAQLCALLPELRSPLRLRLTDHPQSPAVCGLFRPVILLPRSLAEHLPPAQLRAVLLHELLHLRRGDVWVNCAQALLQIAYWWHPLLWLANARIRRVREEAVDDAVMLALNEDAEAYAPTLLEVAKLALHRPLATLGLVGILESRSSLRQRIERLMDFRPPRRAGLTLGSALAVFAFAALALPMGEAPATNEAPQMPQGQVVTNGPASDGSSSVRSLDQKTRASTLTQDGKLLFEMGKLDEAETKLKLALKQDPHNEVALYYSNIVSEAKFAKAAKLHEVTMRQDIRGVEQAWHNPPESYAGTNQIPSDMRRAILRKLDRIRLDSVSFDELPLSEVLRNLAAESRKRDPEKLGVNFIIRPAASTNAPPGGTLDPQTRLPKPATPAGPLDASTITITIKPPLTNARLADVLEAIVKVARQPIKYSILDESIVFSVKTGQEPPPLYVRAFKVDPNAMLDGLRAKMGSVSTNGPGGIAQAVCDYFRSLGVDLDPIRNPGKSLYFNLGHGMLLIRATLQDLDIIEQQIGVLNTVPPQVNIKCKFVEVPQDDTKALGFDWYLGNVLMTNGAVGGQAGTAPPTIAPSSTNQLATPGLSNTSTSPPTLTGILTDPQYRAVIKSLQQRSGTELLAQPQVTFMSGRQVQMKAVDTQTVMKAINEQALTPPGIATTNGDESPLYVTESMDFGQSLDVIASVLPDGYTIALTVIPLVTEFLGYQEDPTNRVAVYVNGKKKWVIPPEPIVRIRQMSTSVPVWDGQTVVLGGLPSETVSLLKDKVPMLGDLPLVGRLFSSESKTINKKNLLIFITPTLIDPVGNRIHAEDELPFTRDAVPPQPAR
jgi:type II secretory pathway component GspD/PulD (secretin)/beta-lactamase regulating signal transducer with metallopeptidase domain